MKEHRYATGKRLIPFRVWAQSKGISPVTAYKLAEQGRVRVVKQGKLSFVTEADDEAYVAALPTIHEAKRRAPDRRRAPSVTLPAIKF